MSCAASGARVTLKQHYLPPPVTPPFHVPSYGWRRPLMTALLISSSGWPESQRSSCHRTNLPAGTDWIPGNIRFSIVPIVAVLECKLFRELPGMRPWRIKIGAGGSGMGGTAEMKDTSDESISDIPKFWYRSIEIGTYLHIFVCIVCGITLFLDSTQSLVFNSVAIA